MRSLPRGTLNAIKRGLVVLLTFLVINFYWRDHHPSTSTSLLGASLNGQGGEGHGGLPYPLPRTRLLRNSIPLTQILNHAPGYTVFRDLYFHKGIYLILTDSPHEIPKNLDHIAFIENRPVEVPKPVEMLEVRREPIIGNFPKGMIHDAFITPEEAVKRFDVGKVEVVKGISFVNNDKKFVNHFYHWIGEAFTGAWRVYTNLFTKNSIPLQAIPDPDRFIFMHVDDHMFDYEDLSTWEGGWRDRQGLNLWYTKKLFPNAVIETLEDWEDRMNSDTIYRFETVILADRFGGHAGPTSSYKPWGDAFRLDVPKNWFQPLRERLLADYKGPIPVERTKEGAPKTKLPVITYITRQTTTRRLTDESHDDLMKELDRIRKEKLAEVNVEEFEERSVEDQIAIMGRTSILISVHGNGLTNALWMNPGPHSGVFEFQPNWCRFNDFGPLAEGNGIPHWIVNADTICAPAECGIRGCIDPENPVVNSDHIEIDASFVAKQVRSILATGKPDYVPARANPLYPEEEPGMWPGTPGWKGGR